MTYFLVVCARTIIAYHFKNHQKYHLSAFHHLSSMPIEGCKQQFSPCRQMGARGPSNDLFVSGTFPIASVWKMAKKGFFLEGLKFSQPESILKRY